MFEDLLNALQNFRLNKTRAFLSLLGIIIGVASVIIITTLGQSATVDVASSFGDAGLDLLQIRGGFGQRQNPGAAQLNFDETFREELWDNIEGLNTIYYGNSLTATLRYGSLEASASISAVENGYLQTNGAELESGRWFTVSETVMGSQKIILGSEMATNLFPDGDAVGSVITLDASKTLFGFEVIGVLLEKSAGMEDFVSGVFVPRSFYAKKIKPNPNASSITVQVLDQNDATAISESIEQYVEVKTGAENMIFIMSMATMIEDFNAIMGTVSLLLSGVATISLLVGGIGIMNIMIVTVTERKKEIGIRKALGATPLAIRGQFLVEAGAVTLLGGMFGIILGVVLAAVITYFIGWTFAIQWIAIGLAFLFSAFVGVFFGYNPAARASKLDPVAALASE